MHGEGGIDCDFCDAELVRRSADLVIENATCLYASRQLDEPDVLPGSGLIIPRAHRRSPFELAPEEWVDTQALLIEAKAVLDARLRPDGYTVAWNVGADGGQSVAHAHLHLIPRFADEPHAGRGARWWIKQDDNRRPDPRAPGRGRAVDRA
ncbi:MAG: HIT family protein [Acidimicrobiales bacterium]